MRAVWYKRLKSVNVNMDIPLEEMDMEGACAVFEPLAPSASTSNLSEMSYAPWETGTCQCCCCEATFECSQVDAVKSHLYMEHSVCIGNPGNIASLKEYLDYWRVRFQEKPVSEYIKKHWLQGEEIAQISSHTEDNELRKKLLKKRLEWIIERQREEREDGSFVRRCFFCRHIEKGSRYKFVTHLSYHHNFKIGKPENLVFIDKLLDKVEEKLNRLECIYCKHVFKEKDILKEHMRKQFHKKINPRNKEFDPYYIVFYLQEHQRQYWTRKGTDCAHDINTLWSEWCEEGSDWSEYNDEREAILCLFCNEATYNWEDVLEHMLINHGFDYKLAMNKYNFYEQVKMVNFIRKELDLSQCYHCKMEFNHREAVLTHMTTSNHLTIPAREDWDRPEFFFSTYENDMFLSLLEIEEDDPLDRLSHQLGNSITLQSRAESPDLRPCPKYIRLDDSYDIPEYMYDQ